MTLDTLPSAMSSLNSFRALITHLCERLRTQNPIYPLFGCLCQSNLKVYPVEKVMCLIDEDGRSVFWVLAIEGGQHRVHERETADKFGGIWANFPFGDRYEDYFLSIH